MSFPRFTDHDYVSRQHLDNLRGEVENLAQRGIGRGGLSKGGQLLADEVEPMPFDVEPYDDGKEARLAVRGGNVYMPGGQLIKVPEKTGLKSPDADVPMYLMLTITRDADGKVQHRYEWVEESRAFTEILTSSEEK